MPAATAVPTPVRPATPTPGESDCPDQPPRQSIQRIAALGLAASLLFTLALCPLGWGLLAFLVGTPLAWLVLDARRLTPLGYATLYFAAAAGWLTLLAFEDGVASGTGAATMLQLAWFSVQIPAAVALGRVGRNAVPLPTYLWLPIVWSGLEYLRGNLFGGYEIGLLGHAVADSRRLIQLTDLVGSYGLGAIMIACGSTISEAVWLLRRLRRLESAMPPLDASAPPDGSAAAGALTVAGGVSMTRSSPPAGPVLTGRRTGRKPQTAQQSLREALRRNRDDTRDRYLIQTVASIILLFFLLVLAHQYGDYRNGQVAGWKLFEQNLYELQIYNGPEGLARLQRDRRQLRRQDGLTVLAMNDRRQPPLPPPPPPPTTATTTVRQSRLDLWRGKPGEPWLIQHSGRRAELHAQRAPSFGLQSRGGRAMVMPRDPKVQPICVACQVVDRPILESIVRRTQRSAGDTSIDAVIIVIDSAADRGSAWPRLLTRSALAAAVANRVAVIGILPGSTTVIASGEGRLLCSALRRPGLPGWLPPTASRPAERSMELGEITTDQVRVSGMFDPRRSFSLRSANLIPRAALAMMLIAIVAGFRTHRSRSRNRQRFGPPA